MFGLKPIKIEVEVDTNRGQPKLIIIGLPSQTVSEAKERITAALLNCGVRIKAKRTVVNLAPADVRKRESCFELAIVAALLKEYGILTQQTNKTIFFGELALDGEIKPMKGALPLVLSAKNMGFKNVIVPAANAAEVAHLKNITIHPLSHLQQLLAYSRGYPLPVAQTKPPQKRDQIQNSISFSDIIGQEQVKRALTISAAGGHNLIMIGPPGCGKSLLARSIISLLPPLDLHEATEVSMIHSISRSLPNGLLYHRPFRNPHHTITTTGLTGGGYDLHPGEISLAHHGVLFLDEINEFSRKTLESLREPLEQGTVTISRSLGTVSYPANFSLIAAANPCPCGFSGSPNHQCKCSPYQTETYRQKVSGPLKDRIDLHLFMEPVATQDLSNRPSKQNMSRLLKDIQHARNIQTRRYQDSKITTNASLNSKLIHNYCSIHPHAIKLLKAAADKLGLSARSYYSVIRVAQTIADLQQVSQITPDYIAEAIQYR